TSWSASRWVALYCSVRQSSRYALHTAFMRPGRGGQRLPGTVRRGNSKGSSGMGHARRGSVTELETQRRARVDPVEIRRKKPFVGVPGSSAFGPLQAESLEVAAVLIVDLDRFRGEGHMHRWSEEILEEGASRRSDEQHLDLQLSAGRLTPRL